MSVLSSKTMRRTVTALWLTACAAVGAFAQESAPVAGWEQPVYDVMKNADALRSEGDWEAARAQYEKALRMWFQLSRKYPGHNEDEIKKRAAYCHMQSQAMQANIEAGIAPSAAASEPEPLPAAPEGATTADRIRRLEDAVKLLHRRNTSLQEQLSKKNENYLNLTDTALTSVSEMSSLKQENKRLQEALEKERQAIQDLRAAIGKAQSGARRDATLDEEVRKRLKELEDIESENREMSTVQDKQRKAIGDLNYSISSLQEQVDKLTAENETLTRRLKTDRDTWRTQCEAEKQELLDACSEQKEALVRRAAEEKDVLAQTRRELEEQVSELKQQMAEMREQGIMTDVIEPLVDEPLTGPNGEELSREELESRVRKLAFKTQSMERYENMLKKENIHLLKQLAPIKAAKQKAEEELARIDRTHSDLELQVKTLLEENDRLKRDMADAETRLGRTQDNRDEQVNLKTLIKQMEQQNRELLDARDTLRQELDAAVRRAEVARKQADDCDQALRQAAAERDAAHRKVESLQEEIRATSELLNDL